MKPNSNQFAKINNEIIEDLKNELRLQGHFLTGALEQSIDGKIISENGSLILSAAAAAYLETLENYTPASQIVISQKEYMQLIGWVKLRKMANSTDEASKIASLIVAKWKKEGRPTKDSVAYSDTGKRTHALKETFDNNEGKYTKMIDNVVISDLDKQFHQIKSGTV